MHDRPLTDEEYEMDDEPRSIAPTDPVGDALGAVGYLQHHTLQDCVERFANGEGAISRYPEIFDRLYFQTPEGPTLVDIIDDPDPETEKTNRLRKHVAFKEQWCAEKGRRYLALPSSACGDVERVRVLLEPPVKPKAVKQDPKPSAQRGQVQRPKAAVTA